MEYFTKAITWLGQQPGVDPAQIWVSGVSRGTEAALLLAEHFPDLVHGVIAVSPSSQVFCGYPDSSKPSWTLGGVPVPCNSGFSRTGPLLDPATAIPVDHVGGPVLLQCGEVDKVWASCAYGQAIVAALDSAPVQHPHRLLTYPQAGHGIAGIPYEPVAAVGAPEVGGSDVSGATPDANELARRKAWPALLRFLAANTH